jgi:hypothetical protein
MGIDAVDEWLIVEDTTAPTPRCQRVKITQLLGEVSCYLLPVHDGNHCSADWREWS